MLRIILLTLAGAVLVAAILVWLGVISWGSGRVEVNPVRVESGTVNVTLPSVQAVPANSI